MIWSPPAIVTRAKIGMSTSAAIRAAPTKKLTTREPHAGRTENAWCGTNGLGERRLCSANSTVPTAERARYHGPAGERTCTSGLAVANARMIPPRATESRPAPTRSASRSDPHQSRTSTSGAAASSNRATNAAASSRVTTPTRENQREPPPANGTKGAPRATEVTSRSGCRITSSIAVSASPPSSTPTQSSRRALHRVPWWRAPTGVVGASEATAAASTRPTARLIQKMSRQSPKASTTAPYNGPSTLPSSCTAPTTPSGTPRRSTG